MNPERPWPNLDALADLTSRCGFTLTERITAEPQYVLDRGRWIDAALTAHVEALADPVTGLAVDTRPVGGACCGSRWRVCPRGYAPGQIAIRGDPEFCTGAPQRAVLGDLVVGLRGQRRRVRLDGERRSGAGFGSGGTRVAHQIVHPSDREGSLITGTENTYPRSSPVQWYSRSDPDITVRAPSDPA